MFRIDSSCDKILLTIQHISTYTQTCLMWNSEAGVTSSNPRVTNSNPRVKRLKTRVWRLKTQVGRSKAGLGEIKPRVK